MKKEGVIQLQLVSSSSGNGPCHRVLYPCKKKEEEKYQMNSCSCHCFHQKGYEIDLSLFNVQGAVFHLYIKTIYKTMSTNCHCHQTKEYGELGKDGRISPL